MRKNILSKLISSISIMIMTVCTIIIIYVVVSENKPSVFGYRFFIVKSGSMQDTLKIGDLIITKKADREQLQIGSVITFVSSNPDIMGDVNTHRIVEIERDLYYTKGDATDIIDQTPVQYEDILGELAWKSAFAGKALMWLSKPIHMLLFLILPTVIVIYLENKSQKIWRFFSRNKEKTNYADEQEILKLLLLQESDSIVPVDQPPLANENSNISYTISNEAVSEDVLATLSKKIYLDKLANQFIEKSGETDGIVFKKRSSVLRSVNMGGFQVAEIKFSNKIRGYSTREVDEYIEKVHKEYTEVCAYLQEKIKSLEASLGNQEDIANAMVRAQSVVRLMEEEGQIKAGKIINEAEVKAQSITSLADIEADRIIREATESRSKIRSEMQQIFNIASLFLKETDALDNGKNEDVNSFENEAY